MYFFENTPYNFDMPNIYSKGLPKILLTLFILFFSPGLLSGKAPAVSQEEAAAIDCPILLYHRFGPVAVDSMTITTEVLASHLHYLKTHGYTVIPLRRLVDASLGKGPPLPAKPVVITVDDGHISVYTEMLPIVKKADIPVTLFIYPSAIGNASYAMTWDQLAELGGSGLFDIQSHTYWHPNFNKERKRLAPGEYEKFVDSQLTKSKMVLEKKLGSAVDMLSWPFGIYDDYLITRAIEAGYISGFTIEAHHATGADGIMKLPRYLLTNANRGKEFEWIFISKENR
jgi:peptidoglycan/xylan/chitin deacetylase (PgdA/CDA1 family)